MNHVNHELVPPRSRSPLPAVDINGFFTLVGQALRLCIQTEGAPPNGAPIYIEEFAQEKLTQEDVSTDLILFRVVTARMAATTNEGVIPKRPQLRQAGVESVKGSGYDNSVYAWWEQVMVEFSILSRSNINGNILAEWFHIFLMKYNFQQKFFLGRGIQNFEFVERKDDPVDHNEGQQVYIRRLSYQFRLERLFATESRLLTNVDLTYSTSESPDAELGTLTLVPSKP